MQMTNSSWYGIAYVGGICAGVALLPPVIIIAKYLGLVDVPDARKVHQRPIPRVGGLAIAIAAMAAAIPVLIIFRSSEMVSHLIRTPMASLIAASIMLLALGFVDDLVNVPAKLKLVGLLLIAYLFAAYGAHIPLHDIPQPAGWHIPALFLHVSWAALPLTMLWLIAVPVSLNFTDGLDGLAGGISGAAALVIAITAAVLGEVSIAILMLALAGSITAFLIFNFNPARVFMGDGGSLFIGFVIAAGTVTLADKTHNLEGILIPAIALCVPLLDTVATLLRRGILHRRSLFAAERGHIHHRLLDLGLSHRHAVYFLYAFSAAAAAIAIAVLFTGRELRALFMLVLAFLLLVLFRTAGSTRVFDLINALRRNRLLATESRQYRRAFETLQLKLGRAATFDAWWECVCHAAEILQFSRAAITLTRRDGSTEPRCWTSNDESFQNAPLLQAVLPIRHRRIGPPMNLEVTIPSTTFLESAGHRLALFARLMEENSPAALPDQNPGPFRIRIFGGGKPFPPGKSHKNAGSGIFKAMRSFDSKINMTALGNQDSSSTDRRMPPPAPTPAPAAAAAPATVPDTLPADPPPATPAAAPTIAGRIMPAPEPRPNLLRQRYAAPVNNLKIAIVHDFLYTFGGAERVLEQMLEVFPHADLFSLFDFLPPGGRAFIKNKPVTTSFLQKMPLARRKHRAYLPLMPLAIEQIDVSSYDIVISSSYVVAKGILTRPDQLHICYCHSPVRFAWDLQHQYLKESALTAGLKSLAARTILHYLRLWDVRTANGVDQFAANSDFVARRIAKAYGRSAATLYPPVDTAAFTLDPEKADFYLTASRMVPYKRMDLIVQAFAQTPHRRLVVIGEGPEFKKIKALAGPNVKLTGRLPEDQLRHYMQHAKAFIFAAEEDFGIVPVEAQACGTPVIAYGHGGATETVVDGATGLLFMEQSTESLNQAVDRFEHLSWDPHIIRANALRFSRETFRTNFQRLVQDSWREFGSKRIATIEAARSAQAAAEKAVPAVPAIPIPGPANSVNDTA